ncbi:Low-density lipoprotein receptor-related protein 2 [Halotydeus destructor]|nr:Low-density lipoprotein receptor-related protein 2 [Halotydeus destructor]
MLKTVLIFFVLLRVDSTESNPTNVLNEYSEQYICKGGQQSVNHSQICDGVPDCYHGDDEDRCQRRPSCNPGHYLCRDQYTCVPFYLLCNGNADCPEGDDESVPGCPKTINKPSETPKQSNKLSAINQSEQFEKNEPSVNVNETKVLPSVETKNISYRHYGSGVFFINFGNIFNGDDNVNGHGNDYGNGNGNGNDNGNGNGVTTNADKSKNSTSFERDQNSNTNQNRTDDSYRRYTIPKEEFKYKKVHKKSVKPFFM